MKIVVQEEEDYFEILTKEGERIKVPNWTDNSWNEAILKFFLNSKDDDESWEDIFETR
ncbi:hypothetical protein H5T89_05075 [bacterium]|nr:hypothetical protein [bacterium]